MTPSRIATAWTNPDGCADVRILPPPSTSSASLLLTAQASHTAVPRSRAASTRTIPPACPPPQVDSAVLVPGRL